MKPTVICEISFNDPGDAPSWVALPGNIADFSTTRGRQEELDTIEAGTAVITTEDPDRALDPANADGPHYGDILPMRRVRIRAVIGVTSYTIFTGFAESFPRIPGAVADAAAVQAVDGFKVLALSGVGGTFPEQRTDERVDALLDDAGWPAADRDISVGESDIQSVLLAQSSALSNLQETVEVENGLLFMGADGKVIFRDRHATLLGTSLATFASLPSGSELPYVSVLPSFDDLRIWNEVRILREGASSSQVADDADSQARFFRRTMNLEGVLITTDGEALAAAQYLVGRYANPMFRFVQVQLAPEQDAALWAAVLAREIGDRVTVIKRGVIGDEVSQECIIQRIAHQYVSGGTWIATFTLSPADTTSYWVLGVSMLGVTTRLAY